MINHYKIEAFWDQEAQVWVAESSDILGLVTEADNLDRLTNKLKKMIPELLAANHQIAIEATKEIAFELTTHRQIVLNSKCSK
jgi:hypothetical protein